MALLSYLRLVGMSQGVIEGDCTQKGREKLITVYEMDHQVEIPRDTHTGLPTGQRVHKPLIITKHIDNASPKIQLACANGERFSEVELKFYQINSLGHEEWYYTIKLVNAIVVSTRNYKPMTILESSRPFHDMEQVAFTYEKIIWKHELTGLEKEDDWNIPNS
ncbi:MAG: type VI secretion system tube protein Hcp [Candidatus Zixiibacteriota bacterium]|nr:MAG: type VI secretion system tube protein Hcp [candidate division Zixibacteria bacterium]